MPQRAHASSAVSSGWLSCDSRAFNASSIVSGMPTSLYRFRMWKYGASPEEFSEEDPREEEIQAVTDFPEWNINKCDRTDDVHWNNEGRVDYCQTCHCHEERCQPDSEMIVGQTQTAQILFGDSQDSACHAEERAKTQDPEQEQ